WHWNSLTERNPGDPRRIAGEPGFFVVAARSGGNPRHQSGNPPDCNAGKACRTMGASPDLVGAHSGPVVAVFTWAGSQCRHGTGPTHRSGQPSCARDHSGPQTRDRDSNGFVFRYRVLETSARLAGTAG